MNKRLALVVLLALGLLMAACAVAPVEEEPLLPEDEGQPLPMGTPTLEGLPELPLDETPLAETPVEEPALTEVPEGETEAVVPPTGGQAVAGLAAPLMRYSVQLSDGSLFAGQIVDLALDLEGASIRYLVVRLEADAGAAGVSGVPIPWELVTIDQTQGVVTLGATSKQLLEAPVMDLSIWPDPLDPQWEAALPSYWEAAGMSP